MSTLANRRIELKVTHRKCPSCDVAYTHEILMLIQDDPLCIVCGKHHISAFIPVRAPLVVLAPKRQQ